MPNVDCGGYSMVEILVSIVVMSIGLLGLAGLQTQSLRFNHDSYVRSLATAQAYDMLDRMRANLDGVESGAYDSVIDIPDDPGCGTSCTTGQIAILDALEWNTDNQSYLPNGQGTVVKSGDNITITVRWDDQRTGVTGLNCSGDSTVDLACFTVNSRVN